MHWHLLTIFCIHINIEIGLCGPLRIASNGVDSVVIAGNEKALIIDASTSFRVERLDAPIERIEIRLMDENGTQPVQVDLQKASTSTDAQSSAELNSNLVIESHPRHDKNVLTETRLKSDEKKNIPIGSFELKVERKIERIMPHVETRRWKEGQAEIVHTSSIQSEYIDDLPPLDIVDETEEEPLEVLPVERCYLNKEKLTAEVLSDMASEKRNLSRILKQYNTQLRAYCSPEHEARDETFRNCPLWREEKMIHYYKLMRLLYCSDYNLWPNAPKIKRSFGSNLQLFEKLYAFMPKP